MSCPTSFQINYPIETIRRAGSAHFGTRRYYEAIHDYEKGIFHYKQQETVPVLRLNLAAAYLKVGSPGTAIRCLQRCEQDKLTDAQKQKAIYRTAMAKYQLGQYDALAESLKEQLELVPDATDFLDLRFKTQCRLGEAQTGNFDWSQLYQDALKKVDLDIAEFLGPVGIAAVSRKGRGLVTTRQVKAGELLLVAKPLAISHSDPKRRNRTLGLNLSSESLDTASQVDVLALLIERAMDDFQIAPQLNTLFAGPGFTSPLKSIDTKPNSPPELPNLDAGRLEGICTFNSFKPQCVTRAFEVQEEMSSLNGDSDDDNPPHMHSASALYFMPSFMNHACIGNASYVFFGDIFVLRASQDIASNEEILDSYMTKPIEMDMK